MSIAEDLSKWGKPEGAFNQTAFLAGRTSEEMDLSGGFCAGVTLDWMRRALLSGSDRNVAFLTYSKEGYDKPGAGPEEMSRHHATAMRMTNIWDQSSTTYVAKTNRQLCREALQQLQGQTETNWSDYGVGVGITSEIGKILETRFDPNPPFNYNKNPVGAWNKGRIAANLASLKGEDPQDQPSAGGGRSWSSMSETLDSQFKQIRALEGRQAPKKAFSNIEVARSSARKSYASCGSWMGTLDASGFSNKCCTIISFAPTGAATGHSVAVHQTDNDTFRFFDPNIGVYTFTKNNLEKCLQHLFWASVFGGAAYYCRPDSPDGVASDGWLGMGYTVFQRVQKI